MKIDQSCTESICCPQKLVLCDPNPFFPPHVPFAFSDPNINCLARL